MYPVRSTKGTLRQTPFPRRRKKRRRKKSSFFLLSDVSYLRALLSLFVPGEENKVFLPPPFLPQTSHTFSVFLCAGCFLLSLFCAPDKVFLAMIGGNIDDIACVLYRLKESGAEWPCSLVLCKILPFDFFMLHQAAFSAARLLPCRV